MSEEEKQAIETVKQYKKCFIFETVHEESGERLNDYSNAVDIVLNLIKRQQEQIEKLNKITTLYNSYEIPNERKIVIADSEYFVKGFFQENFIKKDKIRKLKEKIGDRLHVVTDASPMYETIKEFKDEGAYNILEELLEEK